MIRASIAIFLLATSGAIDAAARLQKQLYETAAARDLLKFDAALDRARSLADEMPLGDARNKLRQSVLIATDLQRVLHFDGVYWDEDVLPDYYDRLAGTYPEFGSFIAQFRLIDRAGRILYPSQETRLFLVKRLSAVAPAAAPPKKPAKRRTEGRHSNSRESSA